MIAIQGLTLQQLKDKLVSLRQSSKGNKSDLLERFAALISSHATEAGKDASGAAMNATTEPPAVAQPGEPSRSADQVCQL